jgi:hypothetical protein
MIAYESIFALAEGRDEESMMRSVVREKKSTKAIS